MVKKKFEIATIKITVGDIVYFEKGMLTKSMLTGKEYITKKAKYLGNDTWESIEKKETKNDD